MEAACLFTLSNWFTGERGLPGIGVANDPHFVSAFMVNADEKIALVTALQAAGVPGTICFRGLLFDGPFGQTDTGHYCPGSIAALRKGVAHMRRQLELSN